MRALLFAGQGSQREGMGAEVLDAFPEHRALADDVLGLSIRELCLHGGDRLRLTRYAQPALFTVHALTYLAQREERGEPDVVAGHSLGEFNALMVAGVLDFATGLRLVAERGRLMGEADGGAMAAVLGAGLTEVERALAAVGRDDVEVANDNSATQVVISGAASGVSAVTALLTARDPAIRCVPLPVSAAFHSREMAPAAGRFAAVLAGTPLAPPRLPVISNVTARPYPPGEPVAALLGRQIRSRVRWTETMGYLLDAGVDEVTEIGRGRTLTGFWREAAAARRTPPPAATPAAPAPASASVAASASASAPAPVAARRGSALGSARFREVYRTRHAYVAGSMFQGIASTDLVVRMAQVGLFGFFGTGGLPLAGIRAALDDLARRLPPGAPYGMNLLHDMTDTAYERATVDLFLQRGVRYVEAAAFTRITAPLVLFRAKGAHRDAAGRPVAVNQVLAKVSRPEVARQFLAPPPPGLLEQLRAEGALTAEEAAAAVALPVASDLCVESDSGGHTDGGVALALLPTFVRLRDRAAASADGEAVRVGAAGGIGTPEAAAACFLLGADFVLTGSVNQCSPQAGTSDAVKDLLAGLDVQDVGYAPAGDLFELGSRVQVVRRGTLFPARANQLYELYRRHARLEDIDARTLATLERGCFGRTLAEVWEETARHYRDTGRPEIVHDAERDPKRRMALVFKWYFAESSRAALTGAKENAANFQIHCGPAMGAFNRLVEGTALESWRRRDVDAIADLLMTGAAEVLAAAR
ncbi:ACP S-malonyltransferase [Streptomyces sp. NBC_01565]|uniref:ACP S-malonyltransferase n=1 Tax=Streptomyces sp. NBC_01565 TaxID=2975881 RepID=UPI00224FB7A1|nr:ACP S-malonyltransferase [Streptomyces sp. NBC_01565]MCX4545465.1 ACP S-malonyltransferase [Streptomyces sp. NBC_01565]